jgi:hypothetical protein
VARGFPTRYASLAPRHAEKRRLSMKTLIVMAALFVSSTLILPTASVALSLA